MADVADHAERMLALINEFERLEDGVVRQKIFELLEHIDHLHRSCVWRMFELTTELGGKGLVDRLTEDAVVKTLFMLYDLIPVDPLMPVDATVPSVTAAAAGFIPLQNVGGRKPSWAVAFAREDLRDGVLQAVEIDRTPVLVCAIDGEVFAYRNACGRSVLPLHVGVLNGTELTCPWHGCRYDIRTGEPMSGSSRPLQRFAVSVRDGRVLVATNTSGPAMAPAPERS